MYAPRPSEAPTAHAPALAAQLQDLLLELALAVHKRAIYPAGHPLLAGAVDALTARLSDLLAERGAVSVGVARHQLVIEGVATDESHPHLRGLATHLHEHQVAAVRFVRGIESSEVDDFLGMVAAAGARIDRPLGSLPQDELQRWQHIGVFPMTFDRLALVEPMEGDEAADGSDGDSSEAGDLWLGLAQVSIALLDNGGGDTEGFAPSRIAEAINQRVGEAAYDQAVISYLLQIAGEIGDETGQRSATLKRQISQLVRALKPETLQKLLEAGREGLHRERLAEHLTDAVAPDAILSILDASTRASGQAMSDTMLRLLRKLAQRASGEGSGAAAAEQELRGEARRVLTDAAAGRLQPADTVGQQVASFGRFDRHRDACSPEEVLQLSLEVGVVGPASETAVHRLVERDGIASALEYLVALPTEETRDVLLNIVVHPTMLAEQMRVKNRDTRVLALAVGHLREQSAVPLLEGLKEFGARDSTWIADLLVGVGGSVLPTCARYLPALPADAQRLLLSVYDRLEAAPPVEVTRVLARNADAGLRREAIRLLLRHDATREDGLLLGVADADERIAGLALSSAMKGCTPRVAAALTRRLDEDPSLSHELRGRAIRALAGSGSVDAMRWIANNLVTRHWLFRYRRLRRPSPEIMAGLTGLAMHWSQAPEAAEVLRMARGSRNADICRAAMARATA